MKRKALVASSLVFVALVMVLTKPNSEGLQLPDCDVTPIVDTEVSFIVDKDVLNANSKEAVKRYFTQSLHHSNLVLKNSCIPMTRSLGSITYVELDKSNLESLYALHKQLEVNLGIDDLDRSYPAPNQIYGLVLPKTIADIADLTGQVEVNLSRKFFTITFDNGIDLIEHELGHLSWAQHKDGHPHNLGKWLESVILPQYHHLLKPYARAFKCGTSGTIMSYEDNILPVYSSPNIFNQGQRCGDPENGDNARAVTEHAHRIAKEMENYTVDKG